VLAASAEGTRLRHPTPGVDPEYRSKYGRYASIVDSITDSEHRATTLEGEPMQLTRNTLDTGTGPREWFTGTVHIDPVASPAPPSRVSAAMVHFTPGARTAWHTHPYGQTIYVTEGVGLCQHRGGPIEEIRPGDRVYFEPGEDHWHGAAPNRSMTHLAMQEADDSGSPVSWGEHVTDEEYSGAASS
jgi:quercetin dioxygenase-like cupin family protein